MRFSGWSSRVTWVSSLAAAAALALAAPAAADVQVSPERIDPGETARLIFWVANRTKTPITAVAVGVPDDFELAEAEAKGNWKTSLHVRTATWEGNRIGPGQFAFFTVTVHAPAREERAIFSILAKQATGSTLTYQASVRVVPPQPTRDRGARTVATVALIVASVALVVALSGGILALWLWLRPRSW